MQFLLESLQIQEGGGHYCLTFRPDNFNTIPKPDNYVGLPRGSRFGPRSDSTFQELSNSLGMTLQLQCTLEKQFTLYKPWMNTWIQDPSLKPLQPLYVDSWASLHENIIISRVTTCTRRWLGGWGTPWGPPRGSPGLAGSPIQQSKLNRPKIIN